LRNGLVRARIGLVVEDVNGAVSDLKEINVAGDRALCIPGSFPLVEHGCIPAGADAFTRARR
jgi:hypothetical protein